MDYHHLAEMYTALGGGFCGDMMPMPRSKMAVLPGTNHVSVMMQTGQLKQVILPFLQ